jgi:cyclopropane-fatty-acyl-phospholipid synthase
MNSHLNRWLANRIFDAIGEAPVKLVIGSEEYLQPDTEPRFTVWIRDRHTLFELLRDPEIGFGEAYSAGRVRVEGDLVEFLVTVYETMKEPRWYSRLASKWMEFVQDNRPGRAQKNIHRHYDLGNEFYKLWLDDQLVYTCAYFPDPQSTLEEAQTAKMDHVCRKLQLEPGETVVEAGCGWGALALHMARHYGVRVEAYNISREQIAYARERACAEGLQDRVEFIEDDYRNINGRFDVFVSIGMLEHVGHAHYREFGEVIHRAIGDEGRGLIHFIGRDYELRFSRWIRKRIFPGAYAPTLRQAMEVLEPHRYAVFDIENLRRHYTKTLEHWMERFEKSRDRVDEMYDEWFERAWRLYLAGSIAGFRTNMLELFQIAFAGPKCRPLAWTRDHLYEKRPQEKRPEEKQQCIPAMS